MTSALAYLGPEGTFSHLAGQRSIFGGSMQLVPVTKAEDILKGVALDHFSCGVVPIEHSTMGSDAVSLDALLDASPMLQIVEEVVLPLTFDAYVSNVWTREQPSTVISHPNALRQCSGFVASLNASTVTTDSTADARERVQRIRDPFVVALAPSGLPTQDELSVYAHNVGDDPDATSRFVVVAKTSAAPTAKSVTTLVLTPPTTKSGSLVRMLTPFADADVNVRELIARPLGTRLGEYRFVLTCAGHHQADPLASVIGRLAADDVDVRVLGSFDAAT
jgi:prephenate dehydratase